MDLAHHKEQSKLKSKENQQFFKSLKKIKPKVLDKIIHPLHDEVFACTDCLKCANCCKTTSPIFRDTDINRISLHLRIKEQKFIENDFFADLAAGGAVFLITLILLFLLSSFIGGWVRKSRLNALDRSLGMLAGLATAALLITGGYVIAENMWTDKPPVWMTKARTLPLIRTSAGLLNQLLPQTFKVEGLKSLDKITGETRENLEKKAYEELLNPRNKKSDIQDREGYDSKERKAMERLLQGR